MPTKNRELQKRFQREHYQRNRQRLIDESARRRDANWAWFVEYKRQLACNKCGENHPACLDFHHRNPSTKRIGVPMAVNRGWNIESVMKEIAKCDVLCSNCHRKEHWRGGPGGKAVGFQPTTEGFDSPTSLQVN